MPASHTYPITPTIIKMVHHIAEQDGMPNGLKITKHTGQVLYDSTWIAGVDYDEDKFEDEDYDPDNDKDEDSNDGYDDDEDNNEDIYDEMDPAAIAALNDPTTLQDDEDSEDSDDKQQPQVKEPDEEEDGSTQGACME
jgi:hypothetical protein